MDEKNRPLHQGQPNNAEQGSQENVKNPFTNNQPADQDIQQSQQDLDNEQRFKEALTERD